MSIDLENMFKEIEMIHKKYGLPTAMGFVPDKLVIVLQRKEEDQYDLTYSEYFDYLPTHALEIAKEHTIQLIQQMGLPLVNLIRKEKGVEIQITGDSQVAVLPIIELFMQLKKLNEPRIMAISNSINKTIKAFRNFVVFQRKWNEDTAKQFNNYVKTCQKIIDEHPSITYEIDAVFKKYTSTKNENTD